METNWWGQFVDHDLTSTSQTRAFNHSIPRCCNVPERHPDCLIIEIPEDDPHFNGTYKCMEFIRSSPAPRADCTLGPREQLNQVHINIKNNSSDTRPHPKYNNLFMLQSLLNLCIGLVLFALSLPLYLLTSNPNTCTQWDMTNHIKAHFMDGWKCGLWVNRLGSSSAPDVYERTPSVLAYVRSKVLTPETCSPTRG